MLKTDPADIKFSLKFVTVLSWPLILVESTKMSSGDDGDFIKHILSSILAGYHRLDCAFTVSRSSCGPRDVPSLPMLISN